MQLYMSYETYNFDRVQDNILTAHEIFRQYCMTKLEAFLSQKPKWTRNMLAPQSLKYNFPINYYSFA